MSENTVSKPNTENNPSIENTADNNTGNTAEAAPEKIEPQKEEPLKEELVSFSTFSKIKLRVAQIVEAERIEKSEKLVKLQVNIGEGENRQIVAGIAKHYEAEELVGRKIVVVANLKPAKLMGEKSEGMLLAASDDSGNLELLTPGGIFAPGAEVR